jgi:hypothetical protein
VGAALLLGGCSYYWSKASGTPEMFDQDTRECAREAAPSPAAASYWVVNEHVYRGCMRLRGWVREKQYDPPPPGWYRGIE